MAVPSKAAQIKRVADFLSDDRNEERTAEELAAVVVNGVYGMWGKELTDPPMHPHVGMAFKVPFLSTVNFVGWMGEEFGEEKVWIINATTDYGLMASPTSDIWKAASASSAKVGGPGTNSDGWEVGQKVSLSQRRTHLSLLSVGSKAVLMRNTSDLSLWAESNTNMKKYYQKESK